MLTYHLEHVISKIVLVLVYVRSIKKFLPFFETIKPNDGKSTEIYYFHCFLGHKRQFNDTESFIQQYHSSDNWYHKMLKKYLKTVYADGSKIQNKKGEQLFFVGFGSEATRKARKTIVFCRYFDPKPPKSYGKQ